MISYEKIDCSEFIDLSGSGVKCMICNCSYFPDGFQYQPYVCNNCHDFSMTVINVSSFLILNIKGINYRVYISGIDKKEAINILNNSELDIKEVL